MTKIKVSFSQEISDLYQNGILNNGEEVLSVEPCIVMIADLSKSSIESTFNSIDSIDSPNSFLCFVTNRRLLVVKKMVSGSLFSSRKTTAYCVNYSWNLDEILSVTPKTIGIFTKRIGPITISTKSEGTTKHYVINMDYSDTFANTLIETKKRFNKEKVIEAQKVIIQEGDKESAIKVLQRRLARGEITIEEFHQIVQRL